MRIVFERLAPPGRPIYVDLFAADPTHPDAQRLPGRVGVRGEPGWSPDGAKVVYVAARPLKPGGSSFDGATLHVQTASGSHDTSLKVAGRHPAWSPDGHRIAYVGIAAFGRATGLYIIGSDGRGNRKVADGRVADKPSWSPDGKRLAVLVYGAAGAAQIEIVNADGTGLTRVNGLPAGASSPVFSPDGSQFAFSAVATDSTGLTQVWTAHTDGSRATQVTHLPAGALQPAWSPDGAQLAVLTKGHLEVAVVNADGTGEKVLTTAPTGYEYAEPDW